MGIPGIFKELGSGKRIAFAKLAIDHLEKEGRPLRVAVDTSIWQFQVQSGQGGKNAALRTFYYRLLRLLSLSVQPIFVFDGPYRPRNKRGNNVSAFASSSDNYLIKTLLRLFGFPYHDAPGEAEAECAHLQKGKIVDAVLTEDVDALMFGSGITIRNWTSEGLRENKTPTHADVYYQSQTLRVSGLDREGMILVALMSGGDYAPDGIPHCGIKVACQAARAGFGKDLVQFARKKTSVCDDWRARINHELHTNESKYFSRRHHNIELKPDFPDRVILAYYTDPVVSSAATIARLRDDINWHGPVLVPQLREFVAEAFSWTYEIGAHHFMRSLAPALLIQRLVHRSQEPSSQRESIGTKGRLEKHLIRSVLGQRKHWKTDGEPETRVAFVPNDIVELDLSEEQPCPLSEASFDGASNASDESVTNEDTVPSTPRGVLERGSSYDPTKMEKTWILETFVRLGCPLLIETWEEEMRDPKLFASRKARARRALAESPKKQRGPMDQYVKVTKNVASPPQWRLGASPSFSRTDKALVMSKKPTSQRVYNDTNDARGSTLHVFDRRSLLTEPSDGPSRDQQRDEPKEQTPQLSPCEDKSGSRSGVLLAMSSSSKCSTGTRDISSNVMHRVPARPSARASESGKRDLVFAPEKRETFVSRANEGKGMQATDKSTDSRLRNDKSLSVGSRQFHRRSKSDKAAEMVGTTNVESGIPSSAEDATLKITWSQEELSGRDYPKLRPRRLVALRESLEGHWKDMENDENPQVDGRSVYEVAHVVDLTSC